jgi:hypothetical protein
MASKSDSSEGPPNSPAENASWQRTRGDANARTIFSTERGREQHARLWIRRSRQHERRKRDVTDVDVLIGQLELRHHSRRNGKCFRITIGLGCIDELDPCLQNFALPCFTRESRNASFVTKSDRSRDFRQTRRDHACDLRRDVGTKRDDLARAGLDEANRRCALTRAKATFELIGALENRRDQSRIAPSFKYFEHLLG